MDIGTVAEWCLSSWRLGLMICFELPILYWYYYEWRLHSFSIFIKLLYLSQSLLSVLPSRCLKCLVLTWLLTGNSEIQAMVACSQQPRRGRQRSSECSWADEEHRAHGRSTGEQSDAYALLNNLFTDFTSDNFFPSLSLSAGHPRSRHSGHDLHICRGQSLAGLQRFLQNVSEIMQRVQEP